MAKKSPLDAVVEEMSLNSELSPQEIRTALIELMEHLNERAANALIDKTIDEQTTLRYAHQFLVCTELVQFYGTALIAFDDIEDERLPN